MELFLERINDWLTLVSIHTDFLLRNKQRWRIDHIVCYWKLLSFTGDSRGWLPEDQGVVDPAEVQRDQGGSRPDHHNLQLPRH